MGDFGITAITCLESSPAEGPLGMIPSMTFKIVGTIVWSCLCLAFVEGLLNNFIGVQPISGDLNFFRVETMKAYG